MPYFSRQNIWHTCQYLKVTKSAVLFKLNCFRETYYNRKIFNSKQVETFRVLIFGLAGFGMFLLLVIGKAIRLHISVHGN